MLRLDEADDTPSESGEMAGPRALVPVGQAPAPILPTAAVIRRHASSADLHANPGVRSPTASRASAGDAVRPGGSRRSPVRGTRRRADLGKRRSGRKLAGLHAARRFTEGAAGTR